MVDGGPGGENEPLLQTLEICRVVRGFTDGDLLRDNQVCDNCFMILPRFTLRTTILGVTLAALFSLVLVRADAGDTWAIAASVAVASLVVIVLVHACLYVVIAATSRVLGTHSFPARTRQGGVQLGPDEQILPGTAPSVSES